MTRSTRDGRQGNVQMRSRRNSYWATDACIDSRRGRRTDRNPWAGVAIVPTKIHGEELDGPARIMWFEVGYWSPPQAELIGCLTAHVLARSDGEGRPVVFTDCQATRQILDGFLEQYRMKRTLPQLASLVEAMGDEASRVQLHWRPRRSTHSMRVVDDLLSLKNRRIGEDPDEGWAELSWDDLLDRAKGLAP